MPKFHESIATFHHPGINPEDGNGWAIPAWGERACPDRPEAYLVHAIAQIIAPEDVQLCTRWVSYSTQTGWTRYSQTKHASSSIETIKQVRQASGGADLRADVWADRPCEITIVQSSFAWEW